MDKKTEIMMTKVVPNVGKLFKAHDAKKFDKFGCKTCHGDAKTKSKDDPKKTLPKLKLSGDGADKLAKSKGPMMKFMNDQVLPAMADSLGDKAADKPMDPGAKGVACNTCHTVE
jgi:hypothetical protein